MRMFVDGVGTSISLYGSRSADSGPYCYKRVRELARKQRRTVARRSPRAVSPTDVDRKDGFV
jgi:hypothetical protein